MMIHQGVRERAGSGTRSVRSQRPCSSLACTQRLGDGEHCLRRGGPWVGVGLGNEELEWRPKAGLVPELLAGVSAVSGGEELG